MKLKRDWFLIGMGIAIFLAWLYPAPGAQGGWLHPEILTKCGVALVFFLHGASLSLGALQEGAMKWKVHLIVQLSAFLFFPLCGLLMLGLSHGLLDNNLRIGLFYLCALPSTVSSSVAMTATAGGNVPTAVFNATLSSLLGIFLTPLWLKLIAPGTDFSFPLERVVLDLIIWLILPLMLGQVSRIWLAGWAKRNKAKISVVDRITILLLVYTSFCDSMQLGVWTQHGVQVVFVCVTVSLLLFYSFLYGISGICKLLQIPRDDRIAAIFCGSKKSLATGVPMAHLIFGGGASLGLILLPIMLYHSLQLIICGVLAGRWSLQIPAESPAPKVFEEQQDASTLAADSGSAEVSTADC